MGFLSFLRGDDLAIGTKAFRASPAVLEIASAGQLSPYRSLGGTNLNTQRINSAYVSVQNASYGWVYLYQPAVRAVIDYLARNIGQLGLKCYERISDTEREEAGDHAAAKALRNPNPRMPGTYFVQEMVKAHLVYGNAYALKFRAPGSNNLVIVPLDPSQVGLIGHSHFSVDAYRIYAADGSYFDRPPEDMIHWPTTTGNDPRRGESPLETLRQLLADYAAARQATTELNLNGLALPGLIERPIEAPPWSEEARKRFEEDWASRAKNRRKTPVLEEGMTFKPGGVTPEDAEMLKARLYSDEKIASMFGMKNVPPADNEERQQFYADVLPPLTDMFSSFLDLHVLVEEYGADDYYFEFSPEKLMDERIKTLTSASGRPVLLTNEARAMLNKPPVDGGDELVTPQNVIVGDNPLPSVGVMPIQNPNGPPQDGSHRSEDVPTPPGKAIEVVEYDDWLADQPAWVKEKAPGNGHKATPLVPRRRKASDRRDRWAGEYQDALAAYFARQEKVTKSKQLKSVMDGRWVKELASDLIAIFLRHFAAEGKHAAFRLASAFDPDYGHNWLVAKSLKAAEDINRVTQEHIDEVGIEDAFKNAKDVRAGGAAMAMATDVAAFAGRVAEEQAPGEGLVTIDGGDCEICRPYQGTWPVSDLKAWPAYHSHCNCVAEVTRGPGKSLGVEAKPLQAETKALDVLADVAKALVARDDGEGMKMLAKAISEQKPAQVNIEPTQTNFHEKAFVSETTIQAPPPAEVNVNTPVNVEAAQPAEVTIAEGAVRVDAPVTVEAAPPASVNVAPAEVTIAKGAVAPRFNVEAAPAPPPAEVNVTTAPVNVAPAEVRFGKGAIQIDAPPPANVNFDKGAIHVDSHTNVEAPPPAEVNIAPAITNVVMRGGKKTVTFSDGREAVIEEDGV